MKRGLKLRDGKFKQVCEIDSKINEVLETQLEEINTPIEAFVTFQTQEGLERCNKYASKKSKYGEIND